MFLFFETEEKELRKYFFTLREREKNFQFT